MRRLAFLLLLLAAPAHAVEYEVFVAVQDQDELDELRLNQEIDDETYQALTELLDVGVDLEDADVDTIYSLPNLTREEADRIVEYRDKAGGLPDPAALVFAGILSDEKLLALAPFLRVTERRVGQIPVTVRGWLESWYVAGDDRVPATLLAARARVGRELTIAVMGFNRERRVGDVIYDPVRDALSAEAPAFGFELPKFFVQWDNGPVRAIAGTYTIGFGQRLTFDTTGLETPNGARPDFTVYRDIELAGLCRQSTGELGAAPCSDGEFGIGDFSTREGLRGAAVGLKRIPMGDGWLQLWGFGSLQTRSIYQYSFYRPDRCADPRADEDPACTAPDVFRTIDDPLAPTAAWKFSTLPGMWREALAGGNATFYLDRRRHVGVTGYGAQPTWLVSGLPLDFQESQRFPAGGAYGAIGVDAAVGWRWLDVFAEVTRSFAADIGGGDGIGALVRGTATWAKNELELSGRWYDDGFANPYARPIAAVDQLEGNDARDEAGVRARFSGAFARRWKVRASADLYQRLRAEVMRLRLYARADMRVTSLIDAALWGEFADQGLDEGGLDECYSGDDTGDLVDTGDDQAGDIEIEGFGLCKGMKVKAAGQVSYRPIPRVGLTLGGQHVWVDGLATEMSGATPTALQRDLGAWFSATGRIADAWTVTGRARYNWYGTNSPNPMEQTVRASLAVGYRPPRARFAARVRYDLRSWLDGRDSTEERTPNPEHWLRLVVEGRF